jgi:hypothetical protein
VMLYRWYFGAFGLRGFERSMLSFAGIKPIRESLFGLAFANETKRVRWIEGLHLHGKTADQCRLLMLWMTPPPALGAAGLGVESEEKREPASDIDTATLDSLKALDPNRPIREADSCSAAINRPIASCVGAKG